MNTLIDKNDPEIVDKVTQLCSAILETEGYKACSSKIDAFLNDDAARSQFEEVQRKGTELEQQQQAGMQLDPEAVKEFEILRDKLEDTPAITEFFEAQSSLKAFHQNVAQHVELTLQLGKLPTKEDFVEQTGCCGGGCGCD